MRKSILNIIILFLSIVQVFGQGEVEFYSGEISFITSNNIYVKFDQTNSINIGDTLFLLNNLLPGPCLIVTKKSSTSCVCIRMNDCIVNIEDQVLSRLPALINDPKTNEEIENKSLPVDVDTPIENKEKGVRRVSDFKQIITGRISASSYSSMSSRYDDKHRMMLRFSLNARNINNSGYSLESYINYRKNISESVQSEGYKSAFLRVYNLALSYEVDPTMSLTLGRKINNKISSLGAIDGLQVEKSFGQFYTGIVAGFRPDIYDYGFNSKLLEYGLFIGNVFDSGRMNARSTLGLMEQRNGGSTDRRYAFFQHSSRLFKKVNLFCSFELDLYKNVNGVSEADMRLTNLYMSLRYRLNRKLDFSVAFDSRKRIIYYETLKTEIERLLDDDIARQGFRMRVNIKPFKYVHGAIGFSKRFQSDNENASDNVNGYISHSRLPRVGGRLSVNYNWNKSNYLESRILSFRHSRNLIKKKLEGSFYYRIVDYLYFNRELKYVQNYIGGQFTFRVDRNWSLGLLGEMANKDSDKNYRVNVKIIKRFRK